MRAEIDAQAKPEFALERRAAAIFKAALDAPPAQRAELIERESAGDGALRERVMRLLAQDDSGPRSAADEITRDGGSSCAARIELPLDFPGYRVVDEVHRGGQGVVYQAIQLSTKKRVAIKVIRDGVFARADERARLEREARILGQLDHRNIVAIRDTGECGGCPFLVMDFVEGHALDAFLARHRRPLADTLRLFAEICEAVQAAHLRGILHRDLKPANIRVDPQGVPHVLDFGLAKALSTPAHDAALTETGQFMGSLPWSSPEQVRGAIALLDTRTDVYSLGVILFQMITGSFPYDVTGTLSDVVRRILDVEPIRPRQFRRSLDDDLETIALKCLAKDRERRYATAGELAQDVRRYLAGEAIEAKRDSALYVLRKSLKRNRTLVGVVAAFAVLISAGLAISLFLWRRAETNAVRATQQAEAAYVMRNFLERMLEQIEPGKARDPDLTVAAVLEASAAALDAGELKASPPAEANSRRVVGALYASMGRMDEAVAQFRAGLAALSRDPHAEPLQRAQLAERLADVLRQLARLDEAEMLARESLAQYAKAYDDDSVEVALSRHNLAMILAQRSQGRVEAEELFRAALRVLDRATEAQPLDRARCRDGLALLLEADGRLIEAAKLQRDALAARIEALGPRHPETLKGRKNLAFSLHRLGEDADAELLLRDVLALERDLYSANPNHPSLATTLSALSISLESLDRAAEAEPLLRECLQIREAALPHDHPLTAYARGVLGGVLARMGRFDEAESALRAAWNTLSSNADFPSERKRETLARMVRLYELWGRETDADEWRRRLEAMKSP